jgi:hypothetical protein
MRILVSIAMVTALGACQTTTDSNTPISAPNTAVSSNTSGPGTAPLSLKTSSLLFQEICVKPFRSKTKFQKAVGNNGFEADPETGTFYDHKRNVSFKWIANSGKPVCSMVFVSKEKPEELGLALAIGSAAGNSGSADIQLDPNTHATRTQSHGNSTMNFTPESRINGEQYYRATLAAN